MKFSCVTLLLILMAAGAVSGATPISPPSFAPTRAGVSSVDVVPLGDGFLAVWLEGFGCLNERELRGMRLDRDGHPRDASSFVVAPTHYETRILSTAADGGDAYIAWHSGYPNAVHLSRVSADATVTALSDSVPITEAASGGNCCTTVMRISNGNILFVGGRGYVSDPLLVTLIDRSGAVVRSGVKVVEQAGGGFRSVDLGAAEGMFVLGWTGTDGLVHFSNFSAADVAANGVSIVPLVQTITYSGVGYLRIASNRAHSMAFWFDLAAHELRAQSLTASGMPSGAPVTVGSFTPAGPLTAVALSDGYELFFNEAVNNVSQPAALRVSLTGTLQWVRRNLPAGLNVAQNGDQVMSVWPASPFAPHNFYTPGAGSEAVAALLQADGSMGASAIISLDSPVQHVRKLMPFAGGNAALWTESVPNDRLVVGRINMLGQPVDGAGLRLRDSIYDQSHSAAASDGEHLFIVWTEGEQFKAQALYGAVVSNGLSLSAAVKQLASDVTDGDVTVAWNGETFTVVYQRQGTKSTDLAAVRVDRSGNVVDPKPVALTPARVGDQNPLLSWNGSEYLLVWQRWYDPFVYIGESCPVDQPYPVELFAQRFSAALAPSGSVIELVTTNNYATVVRDAKNVDVSFAGGLWLVVWTDGLGGTPMYARIDSSGNRLDPLNGRRVLWSLNVPLLAPTPGGWMISGAEGYGTYGAGRGVARVRIGFDGAATILPTVPLSGITAVEAVSAAPVPLVAYKRPSSAAAFIDTAVQRARAVGH